MTEVVLDFPRQAAPKSGRKALKLRPIQPGGKVTSFVPGRKGEVAA